MMLFTFTVKGIPAVQQNLAALERSLEKQAAAMVAERLQRIYDRSQELVPVRTGALKASGLIVAVGLSGEVGYGGPGADYAWRVHEDVTISHLQGQAKYLEQAYAEEGDAATLRAAARYLGREWLGE